MVSRRNYKKSCLFLFFAKIFKLELGLGLFSKNPRYGLTAASTGRSVSGGTRIVSGGSPGPKKPEKNDFYDNLFPTWLADLAAGNLST